MNKALVPIVLFLHLALQANSQYTLITPDGKKVKLNPNGTWQYIGTRQNTGDASSKSNVSLASYRSSNNQFEILFDPSEWICDSTRQKNTSGWDATFYSKDYAVTAFCLASRLTLPVSDLEYSMKQQWQDIGKITYFTTYKDTINNIPVIGFDMKLEASGIHYLYKGYTYSTLNGSFQFLIGTQANIFEEDKLKIEALIKGFKKR
jgi:hypothetical protein